MWSWIVVEGVARFVSVLSSLHSVLCSWPLPLDIPCSSLEGMDRPPSQTSPNRTNQIVDRHCCGHWHMPDPNLYRRSISNKNSRQSRSVHLVESQCSVFTSGHRGLHPIVYRGWDHDHATHRLQACDSNCLALCSLLIKLDRCCPVLHQPHHGRIPGVGNPQR